LRRAIVVSSVPAAPPVPSTAPESWLGRQRSAAPGREVVVADGADVTDEPGDEPDVVVGAFPLAQAAAIKATAAHAVMAADRPTRPVLGRRRCRPAVRS
jgi:hypothetical protein